MPVLLEWNNLLPLLGVAASRSHYLPVQVIRSGAFIGLGTVVSVIASASYGDQVLRAKSYADGTGAPAPKSSLAGWRSKLLPNGQSARLSLQPFHRADAGLGPGKAARLP